MIIMIIYDNYDMIIMYDNYPQNNRNMEITRWIVKWQPALVTPFHNATELEANEWPENY